MQRPEHDMSIRPLAMSLALLVIAGVPAFAQQTPGAAAPPATTAPPAAKPDTEPKKPTTGDIQITTRAPDTDKWAGRTDTTTGNRIFVCKPLACPDDARVSIVNRRSPTRDPDPKALEKYAKTDFPKSLQTGTSGVDNLGNPRNFETLLAETRTIKGFPGVANETKVTTGDKITYLSVAIIFAGPVMIQVNAVSPDRELSQKTLAQFVELMEIRDADVSSTAPKVTLPPFQSQPQQQQPRPAQPPKQQQKQQAI